MKISCYEEPIVNILDGILQECSRNIAVNKLSVAKLEEKNISSLRSL